MRARMVRGIVAHEAGDGSTPFARSNLPRPTEGRRVSTPTMQVRILLGAPIVPWWWTQPGLLCPASGVRISPRQPIVVRSTGVRGCLISVRNLQIRETVRFESVADNQNLPAEGRWHAPSEDVLRGCDSSSGARCADQVLMAERCFGNAEALGSIPRFSSNMPVKFSWRNADFVSRMCVVRFHGRAPARVRSSHG